MYMYPFLSGLSQRPRFHSFRHTLVVLPYSRSRIAYPTGAYPTYLLILQTRALPIMPTEFSLFSALPTELREEIWNLAIRPKRSGVHIFRVYSTYMDHETSPEEVIHFSANEASFYGHERCELSLAVPLPHKSLDGANKDGARMTSSYMIDTGLWTACHESRSMMKKAFLTIKNTRHGKVYIPNPVMCYYHSGGARFYFTVRPMSDLFIL